MAGELRRTVAALAAIAVLGACGPGDERDDAMAGEGADLEVPRVEAVPRTEQDIAAGRLLPVNNSGVTGSVSVRGIGDRTEFAMNVTGLAAGGPRVEAAVVQGPCDAPGAAVAPVGPLEVGPGGIAAATDTIALAPGTVLDGTHSLVVRGVEARPGIPVLACSPLPPV